MLLKRGAVAAGMVLGTAMATSDVAAQEATELREIIVSGGRTPIGASEIGRSYTVLTGAEMEARGIRYVSDALRRVPGLAVTQSGGPGSLTRVNVRGAESNQVLVLIDGVEAAGAADGEFDFGSLLAADIERIEVLRGPQSSLYGSNAAAGVISILTKGGVRNDVVGNFALEGGSDGTAYVLGALRGGGETWDASVSAALRRSDGFNVATGTGDREGEMDGDRNLTLNAKANWDATDDLSFGATARFVDRESMFDEQFFFGSGTGRVFDADNVTDAQDVLVSAFGSYGMLGDALIHTVRFEYTDTLIDSLTDDLSTFRSDSARYHGSYQASYAFDLGPASHVVTGAAEYEEEINNATTGRQTRTLFGILGEYRGTFFDRVAVQAGLRHDFNDEFEDATTYSVGVSYLLDETGTRLHGSVGRGVTNPSFIEQFGFFPGSFVGNPALEPERTFQWDLGVEQTFLDGRLIVDATYFRGKVTDEIVGGFDVDAGLPTSVNSEGESPRQGVELSLTAVPVEPLTVVASYTYVLSQDAQSGFQEVRRPRHAGSLDVEYSFLEGRGRINAGVTYSGDRRDFDFTTGNFPAPLTVLDSNVRVNVGASYDITDRIEGYVRIENATNTDYQEVFNFETQGVAGFAGLRIEF